MSQSGDVRRGQPVRRGDVDHLAGYAAVGQKGAARGQQGIYRVVLVQPLDRLGRTSDRRDRQAVPADGPRHPGVGMGAEHRGQAHYDMTSDLGQARPLGHQLLKGVRALHVGAGFVWFADGQGVVGPRAVHSGRRSKYDGRGWGRQDVARTLDIDGVHGAGPRPRAGSARLARPGGRAGQLVRRLAAPPVPANQR